MLHSLLRTDRKLVSLIVPLIGATLASVAFAQDISPASISRAKQSVVLIEQGRRQFSDRTEQTMQRAQAYCTSPACAAALMDVRSVARRHGALKGAAVIEDAQLRRELMSNMSKFIHAYRDEHPEYSSEFAQAQWVERIDQMNAKMESLAPASEGQNLTSLTPSSPGSWIDPTTPSDSSCASGGCKHQVLATACVVTCGAAAVIAVIACDAFILPPLIIACDVVALAAQGFCSDACVRTYCD